MRVFLAVLFAAASSFSAYPALAGSGPSAALPHGATVQRMVRLRPADAYAVLFRDPDPRLGIISLASRPQLIWQRRLPSSPSLLQPRRPNSLVAIAGRPKGGEVVFAYTLAGRRVTSAIAGVRDGRLAAGETVHVKGRILRLWSHDTGHRGEVQYRQVQLYRWVAGAYQKLRVFRRPDYPAGQEPLPNAAVHTRDGNTILLQLEIASTPEERDQGLMNRPSLDPDAGMIFVWTQPVQESFWMENTLIPLTVAFLAPDGTLQETQDMAPETLTLHTPAQPYQYAIEANQGFFQRNGIQIGDRFQLHLQPMPRSRGAAKQAFQRVNFRHRQTAGKVFTDIGGRATI